LVPIKALHIAECIMPIMNGIAQQNQMGISIYNRAAACDYARDLLLTGERKKVYDSAKWAK
jgi:hypothetical protein